MHEGLTRHLIREDGEEDLCLAMYAPSTGAWRDTALIREACLPLEGEREVDGNATVTGRYVLRVARKASERGLGVVILHSHPGGRSWQWLSDLDEDAEASYAHLVEQVTGLPLVGMTLAGRDQRWSARWWSADGNHVHAESVRVVGARLDVSWNEQLVPAPSPMPSQLRTVSAWGVRTQADIARLRVLVVGAGSVGMDVAIRLAATGIRKVGVMDFDVVKEVNRDRLVAATPRDARLQVPKVDVARRACVNAATAAEFEFHRHNLKVTNTDGQCAALDYDVIFSCVDRPWPRAVLNQLAYTDLIPVIDGGIGIDTFPTGEMRNATYRTHVVRPGRPCLQCNGQLDPAQVSRDRLGLFDDPTYIEKAGQPEPGKQNVAMLSASVMASQLALFVSLVAAPSKFGEPGQLRFSLTTHRLEHVQATTSPACTYENLLAYGDQRIPLVQTATASLPLDSRRPGRRSAWSRGTWSASSSGRVVARGRRGRRAVRVLRAMPAPRQPPRAQAPQVRSELLCPTVSSPGRRLLRSLTNWVPSSLAARPARASQVALTLRAVPIEPSN